MKANDIARLLAQSIDGLVRDLLPGGKREGHEWCVAAIYSPFGCSVSVHLTGNKAGVWSAWAAGIGGDALNLVRAVLNIDMAEALRWSKRWLGIEEGAVDLPARPEFVPAHQPAARLDDETIARQTRALDIWREAIEDITGTPAELYLHSRGLDPSQLYS